jgi:cellulose synthase/poly-beta-1,6-N-acetylglucosamine synthase-like glycosyltransferase
MVLLWLLFGFLLVYGLLLFYYKRGWQSLPEDDVPQQKPVFISVVVAARNEEKNIATLLNALQHQSFSSSSFEFILVDDFSTDDTVAAAQTRSLTNLKIIQPPMQAKASSKKAAIDAGVQAARGELIVTTDADCIPGSQWLQAINNFYVATDASFVAAPVKFSYNTSWLQRFQALDFLMLQGITAASVATGFHSMCNGANLAYKKEAFNAVRGFSGIDKVASGDDMLLMHKIVKQKGRKVLYLKSKDAIVTTTPMFTLRDFIMQRRRWASKTMVYDDWKILAVLIFIYFFNLLFFVLLIAACIESSRWWYVAVYLISKALLEWNFVVSIARFYNATSLVKDLFLFQPFHILYTVAVGALGQLGKYEWKGRRTK